MCFTEWTPGKIAIHNTLLMELVFLEWYLGEMYFCLCEPLAVSGRCQTRIPGWSRSRVYWRDASAFWWTWRHCQQIEVAIEGLVPTQEAPGSIDNKPERTLNISKKHFRMGGMAAPEWTRSVQAVRDTPVADYSMPSVSTMRRVVYRTPIAVSPFFLVLSGPYSLWRCGQL
jgi:hypothetical protein